MDTISECTPDQPSENATVARTLAATRRFVRWDKVYDKDGRRIWHWRFRRFYWKSYQEGRHMSVYENATSIAIGLTTLVKGKRTPEKRYIISFKNGRVGCYYRCGNVFRRFIPMIQTPVPYGHAVKDDGLRDTPGVMRNEKRLMRLILTKARANKVIVPSYVRREAKTVQDLLSFIMYPATLDLKRCGAIFPATNTRIVSRFLRYPLKRAVKIVSGYDSSKLIRLVQQSESKMETFVLLRILKGTLSIDHLHQVLESKTRWVPSIPFAVSGNEFKPAWANVRSFLARFKDRPNVLVKWITMAPSYLWRDVLSDYAELSALPGFTIPDTTSMEELHTIWTRQRRLMKVHDRPIHHPEALLEAGLEGIKVNDYTIAIPKTTGELAAWGDELSNCVGGYTDLIESGRSWILGLKDGDKVVYCIEADSSLIETEELACSDHTIRQFKGKHNHDAPRELVNRFMDVVHSTILARKAYEERLEAANQMSLTIEPKDAVIVSI